MLLPVVSQGGDEYIDVFGKNIILVIIMFFCFLVYTTTTAVSPLLVPKTLAFITFLVMFLKQYQQKTQTAAKTWFSVVVICALRRFYEASAPQTTPKRPNNE